MRRVGLPLVILLLVAGAGLLALGVALHPGDEGGGERAVTVRGPALARYDAQNDSTYALFRCSHWYCATAYVLPGDQTRAVAHAGGLMVDPDEESAWRTVTIPPLESPFIPAPVTAAYAGPFDVEPTWPRLGLVVAGFSLVGVGAGLGLALRMDLSRVACVVAPVVAVLPFSFAFSLGDGVILAFMAWAVLFSIALGGMTYHRFRRFMLPLFVGLVLAVPAALLGAPFLPTEPAL